jgi:head-tail adaptor
MISGGVLTHKATRLIASSSRDQIGLRADTWNTGASFRCDLRNDSSNEQTLADGIAVRRAYEVRARWRAVQNAGLTEVDRLSIDGRVLRITAIRDMGEKHRVAIISAEEID